MRIAIITPGVHHQAGPANVTAALVEKLCEDHQVSVFSHTIEGIDLAEIRHYKVPAVIRPKFLAYITFLVSSTMSLLLGIIPNMSIISSTLSVNSTRPKLSLKAGLIFGTGIFILLFSIRLNCRITNRHRLPRHFSLSAP